MEEGDPEEALLAEMAAIKERMESRLKREKKHRREMKKKAKIRALQVRRGGRKWQTKPRMDFPPFLMNLCILVFYHSTIPHPFPPPLTSSLVQMVSGSTTPQPFPPSLNLSLVQMVSGSGILTEEQQDGLFSLNVIKGGGKAEGGARAVLARVTEVSAPGEDDMAALEADSDSEVCIDPSA